MLQKNAFLGVRGYRWRVKLPGVKLPRVRLPRTQLNIQTVFGEYPTRDPTVSVGSYKERLTVQL